MPTGIYERTKPNWNKGLTKETDERITRNALSNTTCGYEVQICPTCDKSFLNKQILHKKIHCSRECNDKSPIRRAKIGAHNKVSQIGNCHRAGHHVPRITITCLICGNRFIALSSHNRRFCSNKCAVVFKISNNFNSHGYGKCKFRKDLDKFFRSTWEANFARVLNLLKIVWEYESKECRFNLDILGTLILDFYLPELNLYIEVKGQLMDDCKRKWEKFLELYPNKKVLVLDGKAYKVITKIFKSLIIEWEAN